MVDAKEEKKFQRQAEISGFAGAMAGPKMAAKQAKMSDAMVGGMNDFLEMAGRFANSDDKKGGNLFETIVSAKENVLFAKDGCITRTNVTHFENNRDNADLRTLVGKRLASQGQAKLSINRNLSFYLGDKGFLKRSSDGKFKYVGMRLLAPADMIPEVRAGLVRKAATIADPVEKSQILDMASRIEDHKTTTSEVRTAMDNPRRYALSNIAERVGVEMATTVAISAASAAVVGGAVSLASNASKLMYGEMEWRNAASQAVEQAKPAATRAAAVAVAETSVRNIASIAADVGRRTPRGAAKLLTSTLGSSVTEDAATVALLGNKTVNTMCQKLSDKNVATAVAVAVIESGVTVYKFAKGEVSAAEAMERLGQTGFSTGVGLYFMGASAILAAQAWVGATMGVIGFTLASSIYQSALTVLQEADLAEAEAARVEALCAEAIKAMREQRAKFESALDEKLAKHREAFDRCFAALDVGMEAESVGDAIAALSDLADTFGRSLKFESLESFENFMENSDAPLVL